MGLSAHGPRRTTRGDVVVDSRPVFFIAAGDDRAIWPLQPATRHVADGDNLGEAVAPSAVTLRRHQTARILAPCRQRLSEDLPRRVKTSSSAVNHRRFGGVRRAVRPQATRRRARRQ